MSYAKTAIYSNLTANSLILERDEGGRIYVFLRKKRKGKELNNRRGKTGSWRRLWRW
jgi:hypothetical protein